MNRRYEIIILTVSLLCICSTPASAIWGIGESKKEDSKTRPAAASVPRRYHLSIPDTKTEKELLGLFNAKRNLNQDVMVLGRLIQDKRNRIGSVEKGLKDEFEIDQTMLYKFDAESSTLSRSTIPAQKKDEDSKDEAEVLDETPEGNDDQTAEESDAVKDEYEPFKQLNEDEAARFMDLTSSKRRRMQEISVLQMCLREQQSILVKVSGLLESKFGMNKGKMYDYDKGTMKLYEISSPQRSSGSSRR